MNDFFWKSIYKTFICCIIVRHFFHKTLLAVDNSEHSLTETLLCNLLMAFNQSVYALRKWKFLQEHCFRWQYPEIFISWHIFLIIIFNLLIIIIIIIIISLFKSQIVLAEHEYFTYWGDCKSNQMLVFEERGKPEYPEKNQQTQPTHDADCGNRTRDTLVEGERFHHCANYAPLFNLNQPLVPIGTCSQFLLTIPKDSVLMWKTNSSH